MRKTLLLIFILWPEQFQHLLYYNIDISCRLMNLIKLQFLKIVLEKGERRLGRNKVGHYVQL